MEYIFYLQTNPMQLIHKYQLHRDLKFWFKILNILICFQINFIFTYLTISLSQIISCLSNQNPSGATLDRLHCPCSDWKHHGVCDGLIATLHRWHYPYSDWSHHAVFVQRLKIGPWKNCTREEQLGKGQKSWKFSF